MNGMDDNEDETNFSDDGLDALPVNALVELEQNAIQSTQQPAKHFARVSNRYGGRTPSVLPKNAEPGCAELDSDHFGAEAFDDTDLATPVEETDDLIPARPRGEMTQRNSWQQARYGQCQQQGAFKPLQVPNRQPIGQNVCLTDNSFMRQRGDTEMQESGPLGEQAQPRVRAPSLDQELALRAQVANRPSVCTRPIRQIEMRGFSPQTTN